MKRLILATVVAMSTLAAGVQAQSLSGRDVVERAQKATGSDSVMKKHKSMTMTGKLSMPAAGMDATVVNTKSADNRFRLVIDVGGMGTIEQGYAEGVAYMVQPGVDPMILTGAAAEQMKRQAEWRENLDDYLSITNEGQETYAGKNAYKVKLVAKDSSSVTKYYEVETGLGYASVVMTETPAGPVEVVTMMSEFKNFGGMTFATKQVQQINGMEQIITVDKIEFDVAPADAFDLPAAVKALKK